MLASRIAVALLEHDPGWRLPRRSDLARRYNVTVLEIDAAISQGHFRIAIEAPDAHGGKCAKPLR